MKHAFTYSLEALAVFIAACVAPRPIAVVTPVGPAPFERARETPEGELTVYSSWDIGMSADSEGTSHHSGYRIYSAYGKQLKYVNNWVGTFIEDPAVVSLPPGRYGVLARAAASGMVTVPVAIEAGKTTSVHLDGSRLANGRQTSESDLVRLPDGRIVGWRAKENGEVK